MESGGIIMKKVLWFSRHAMTEEQKQALIDKLEEIEITQVNKTITSAYDIREEIETSDVVAIVAPIHIQEQVLRLAGDKPVIMALSERVIVDGDKVTFKFVKWERLVEVRVIKENF